MYLTKECTLLKNVTYLKTWLDTFDVPFLDLAVQNVSMALRAHPRFEVVKNLPEIGWRAMKQYFQVKDAEEVIKCEKVLAWMSPGPDAIQDQRTLISLQKSLTQMQVIIFKLKVYFFYKMYTLFSIHPLCLRI